MAGRLYVVATPIGNLDDLTSRAAEVLRAADCVAAEDTRRAAILLKHIGARPRLISYREENHARASREILELLSAGATVALVSDAGTPAISDPGVPLVRDAIAAGVKVTPIPGATAVATVLSAAGIPCGSFRFVGFLARSGRRRRDEMARIARDDGATIIYESPHRVGETLADLAQACGEAREACVAREVTTVHEEFLRGTLGELATRFAEGGIVARGEFVVVLTGADGKNATTETQSEAQRKTQRRDLGEDNTEKAGAGADAEAEPQTQRDTVDALAREFSVPRRIVYAIANRLKRQGDAK